MASHLVLLAENPDDERFDGGGGHTERREKTQLASLSNLYKVKDSRFGVHHDEPGEERDGDDSSEHVDNEDPRRNRQKSTGLVEICANSNGRQPRSARSHDGAPTSVASPFPPEGLTDPLTASRTQPP